MTRPSRHILYGPFIDAKCPQCGRKITRKNRIIEDMGALWHSECLLAWTTEYNAWLMRRPTINLSEDYEDTRSERRDTHC